MYQWTFTQLRHALFNSQMYFIASACKRTLFLGEDDCPDPFASSLLIKPEKRKPSMGPWPLPHWLMILELLTCYLMSSQS